MPRAKPPTKARRPEKPRIVNTTTVPINEVTPHPDNPRKGNIDRLAHLLTEHGQYQPILVHHQTGHIIAGNHRWKAARDKLGWDKILVTYVSCTDAKARAILAADNRASDDTSYDSQQLLALLETMSSEGTLTAGGYDTSDLDDLQALLEETPTGYDDVDGNLQQYKDLATKAENYADAGSRLVMLSFRNDVYIWIVDKLAELAATYQVDNSAAAVQRLIEDATGDTP